jgi:putative RNA 2'-phosphotransferase
MPNLNFTDLSKVVSHALRHEPWLYDIDIDAEGWTAIQDLLEALHQEREEWSDLTKNDLMMMLEKASKRRHEIKEDKIRALYGHSMPNKIVKTKKKPPLILYHGTAPEIAEIILTEGLKAMGRQHIHLATEMKKAIKAGKRKSNQPVILEVLASKAFDEDIAFYEGNEIIWLADYIPPKFIHSSTLSQDQLI